MAATHSFQRGDVVQLRSGGPMMTVNDVWDTGLTAMWHNTVSGLVVQSEFHPLTIRGGLNRPVVPEGQREMRHTSHATEGPEAVAITKSSLSS